MGHRFTTRTIREMISGRLAVEQGPGVFSTVRVPGVLLALAASNTSEHVRHYLLCGAQVALCLQTAVTVIIL